jgi:predicted DNA-binding protein (MmcQ/YjbR family)
MAEMNIESLRALCLSFPDVTEDIKWGNDLCFLVGEKMFCVTSVSVDEGASFKVCDEEFEEMTSREGIIPAPYLARAKWVYVLDFSRITDAEWQRYVRQSYELVKAKLPKKLQESL